MANSWFRFYGSEFLADPKMLSLTIIEKCCWVTLLCFASSSGGTIKYLSEEKLMLITGVKPGSIEWESTRGILRRFEEMGMLELSNGNVTVKNWEKRQYSEAYLRVKEYRKRNSNANVTGITDTEQNRTEQKQQSKAITWEEILAHPMFPEIQKKYPDHDLKFQYGVMLDWWDKNKRKKPQMISAFTNWMVNAKPDPGIISARREKINQEQKKVEEKKIADAPPVKKETLDKLNAMKNNLSKKLSI